MCWLENQALVPDSLQSFLLSKSRFNRVITLSTTHVAMIHQLGMAKYH